MITLNIAISIGLAISGAVLVNKGNPVGYVLFGCIALHWTLYAARNRNT